MDNQSIENEINLYKQKFYSLYISKVMPILEDYENERKNTLRKLIKRVSISAIITILTLIPIIFLSIRMYHLLNNSANIGWEIFGSIAASIIFIISLIVTICIPAVTKGFFIDNLKKTLYDNLLNVFGDLHWHAKENVIPDSDLVESGLFSRFTNRYLFDGFSGNYKGIPFFISETSLTYETRKYSEGCFYGVVIKIKANKDIKTRTIIFGKNDTNINNTMHFPPYLYVIPFFPLVWLLFKYVSHKVGLFELLISIFIFLNLLIFILVIKKVLTASFEKKAVTKKVNLEDVSFNKNYNVQTNDQVEARYLVTPAFMERFKNLEAVYNAVDIKCSFYGDNLMFAITTTQDTFEFGGLITPLNNPKKIETFFEELVAIYLLIDYFKLDEKTGL